MMKMTYVVLGAVMLSATMLMVGAASDKARSAPQPGQDGIDIRALERTVDLKALPQGDLNPEVYQ